MNYIKKKRIKEAWSRREINPEDIFMDSKNLANLDENQFEGRLSKPIPKKTGYAVIVLLVILLGVFLGRLYYLQIARGEAYANWSQENRLKSQIVFANRGIIEDRNGSPLAWNENIGTSTGGFPQRMYVDESGFSHLLGYAKPPKKDKKGVYYEKNFTGIGGVEEYYHDFLEGENGQILVEEDARQEEQSSSVVVRAEDGKNLKLTIDKTSQKVLFESIRDLAQRAGFVGGAGILMDAQNGEIIAITSYPEYDSQVLSLGQDERKIQDYLLDDRNLFLNRAVSGLYTPGSTVKPFIATAALEERIIDPEKELLSKGALVVPNPYFPDKPTIFHDWKAHGWVDMREALAQSSNEYFFKIGGGFEEQEGLGIKKINEYIKKFGLGKKTGIDLYGEGQGIVPSPEWKEEVFNEKWRIGDTYNTSIGQYGFQITPLELIRAISAVANGGFLVEPHLRYGNQYDRDKIEGLDDRNLKIVREGMKQGVEYGTASSLNVSGLSVAAKTGTAEIGAGNSFVNSWVAGFFPYENPKYTFVIVMEKATRENTFGATLAGKAFLEGLLASNSYVVNYGNNTTKELLTREP